MRLVPGDVFPNTTKLVCPRCGCDSFYEATAEQAAARKKDITEVWTNWKAGTISPAPNGRQIAVLNTWEAFIADHPTSFEEIVRKIPEHLTELYHLAAKV